MMGWPCGYGIFGGWGWLGMLIWTIVLVLLVYLVVQALTRPSRDKGKDHALEILRERYARGELDKESFERLKRDLEE